MHSRDFHPSARSFPAAATPKLAPSAQEGEQEIDFIGRELSAAFGLGGRAKKAASSSERIRKTVSARIREALGRIETEHPDLGRHFSLAIRTGTFCCYNPEKPTSWQL